MTQLYRLKSTVGTKDTRLFSGIWICWSALTTTERFVCANIVLLPLWWVVGLYYYMPLLLLFGVAVYEWQQYGKLRLKSPSLPVVALLAFGMYQLVKLWLASSAPPQDLFDIVDVPQALVEVVILSFCPAFWLWCIQSNNVRIRLEVVAWACTVSVVQMIGFWLLLQFVLPETVFFPPSMQNLFALLTNKGAGGFNDLTKTYYLWPYQPYGNLLGLSRFSLFFTYPEIFAVVAGVMGIVALDIKNRFWSRLLFFACVFLILLSGTRIVWIVLPVVVGLRYLFTNLDKLWGPAMIFALIAIASFTTLSLPPATNLLLNNFTRSTQSINEVREDSSELRMEIYSQTWEGIQNNPLWGHHTKGPPINPYIPFGRVGTHSFILGNLLYRNGLIGTGFFVVFWISLLAWLYKTRVGRPYACFCVLLFYTLISATLEFVYEMPLLSMLVLLGVAIRRPKLNPIQKLRYA